MSNQTEQVRIPDYLKPRHAELSAWAYGPVPEGMEMPSECSNRTELEYIECIARVEAERDALKADLGQSRQAFTDLREADKASMAEMLAGSLEQLREIDALKAENDRLKARLEWRTGNAGQTHYGGCYKDHYDCAMAALQAARKDALEDAAKAIRGAVFGVEIADGNTATLTRDMVVELAEAVTDSNYAKIRALIDQPEEGNAR